MLTLPITLVVITHNEAENIARCLDSVPFAAEKLVVDSGSEDDTVAVAQAHGARVVLQVADHGPGIKDAEKKKIFTRFYRIGNEESRKAKGTGLGLYLTSKIVLQHKGRIAVKDNAPSGAVFEIALPV